MPLYDYYCQKCSKAYEVKVPLAKRNKKIKCPYCKEKMAKKMSPVYFKISV